MEEFNKLLNFIELNIKDKIKEGNYIQLLGLIQNIYLIKKQENDSDIEEESDIYGSYWLTIWNDIYSVYLFLIPFITSK